MRQLPFGARVYLIVCYLLGGLALAWLILSYRGPVTREDWMLGFALAAISSICQVFVVARIGTEGQRSDHLTLAPLLAATLLLPRSVLAVVIVWTFVPEWYLRRRSWYGQVFNMAVFLIAAALGKFGLSSLTGYARLTAETLPVLSRAFSIPLLIPVFQGTQALMLALVLKLARGQSFRTSGLFTLESLLLEGSLLCMGLGFAVAWVVNPLFGLLAAVPLVLIFQALHVPNLKEQATTDSKTGLANMRHFKDVFARDLERARRSNQPLSLLVCDLDYLRNINNSYGHQAGDVVLVGLADAIRHNIRGSDLAARFGGEEFVVLLADTDGEDARRVAERIRSEFERTRFEVGEYRTGLSATVSIGVASFPKDARTGEGLLREADLAVYQAKRNGRNRVSVAGRASRALAGEWAREHLMTAAVLDQPRQDEPPRPFWESINRVTGASSYAERPPAQAISEPRRRRARPNLRRRQEDRNSAPPSLRVLAFIGAVVVAGLLGLWRGLSLHDSPWLSLGLFAVLSVLAELFAVDNAGRGKISVSVVTILAAGFLYDELGILVAASAAVLSMAVKVRRFSHRMVFNFGTVLLAAEGGLWIFETWVGPAIDRLPLAVMLVPGIAAGLVYHLINQVLLCTVRGLTERRPPWLIWYDEYRWLWPHYAVLGALAIVIALGYRVFGGIGVVALMAPVGMMHLAIKQHLDRSRVFVGELRQLNAQLSDSYEATLQALSRALDTRDDETEAHSQRVCRYTQLLGERLGISEDALADILRGALLHDIGKIGVPDAVLLKPGDLSDEEREQMRRHPEIGYNMIANIPFLAGAAQVVLHHHEAYDGSGYPSGLTGENIPLGARLFAVADAFDAMTSDRPYRRALPVNAALAELQRCRGNQFDPRIVDTLLAIPLNELLARPEKEASPAHALGRLVLQPLMGDAA